ncbi:hypothetical protein BYT27DRAFT_7257150 [Phlegmacium glaucopus]|nr:hypothetical protein BYT27DRAFT_7257150 [Phlegmacium glaucopus]
MFTRISRLPLRRCLHTGAPVSNATSSFGRTAKIIVGVSVFSTAYLTWRLRESRHIASDDDPSSHNSSPYSTSNSSLSSIHSKPPSRLTSSSDSPPNDEVPLSSTGSDTGTNSEDANNENKVDEEDSSGSPASGGGAFNPETGEINWDCPCLGGMAHGPCGPEFREAFSCFVYSEAEPKGINCVEKFQNMQNCFRAHPEIYADEIMNDDDEDQPPLPESSSTENFDGDVTPELNTPPKPPIEGEVSS